jgi:hypothetical protein
MRPGWDAVCLNLRGIICQARGEWKQARRFFGKAMRADRGFVPARQNMRRLYELDTFGATRLPVALVDGRTLAAIGNPRPDSGPPAGPAR